MGIIIMDDSDGMGIANGYGYWRFNRNYSTIRLETLYNRLCWIDKQIDSH